MNDWTERKTWGGKQELGRRDDCEQGKVFIDSNNINMNKYINININTAESFNYQPTNALT